MQQVQKEKLKTLIRQSSIFNDIERSEWLTLLDLMNDKQANELEKILVGAEGKLKNPKPGFLSQKASVKPVVAPVIPEGQEQKPAAPAAINFKHIMNFPKPANEDFILTRPGVFPVKESTKSAVGFLAKIKSILSEKELPEGHPDAMRELELPQHTTIRRTDKVANVDHPVKPAPLLVPKPSVSKATNGQKQGTITEFKGSVLQDKKVEKPLSGISRSVLGNITEAGASILASIENKEAAKKDSGINLGKMSDSNHAAILKFTKTDVSSQAEFSVDLNNLKEPKDVSTLNVDCLTKQNVDAIISKLKSLIKRYGYHEVVFNLEHSPLHKAYIDTGIKLLDGKTTFEDLLRQPEGVYLTKQQFEDFVDILRQLQAG